MDQGLLSKIVSDCTTKKMTIDELQLSMLQMANYLIQSSTIGESKHHQKENKSEKIQKQNIERSEQLIEKKLNSLRQGINELKQLIANIKDKQVINVEGNKKTDTLQKVNHFNEQIQTLSQDVKKLKELLSSKKGQVQFQAKRNQNTQKPPQSKFSAPSSTLFIGNLSFNVTQDQLKQFFSPIGQVKCFRIGKDKETQKVSMFIIQSKGFAYAEFFDVQTAQKAVQKLNLSLLNGRKIRLDFAAERNILFAAKKGDISGHKEEEEKVIKGLGGISISENQSLNLADAEKTAKKGAIYFYTGKKNVL